MRKSLYILLFITFIDFLGIGLVYPIFSKMIFASHANILPLNSSETMKGFYLGLLYALMPLMQFFSSPIWGTLSDGQGRKKPLKISLFITTLGHLTSAFGIFFQSLIILLLSRAILGLGGGNISIVQASIADISSKENKAKNFGLYTMAIGAGFTLGPFFGGFLSFWGYATPFIFAFLLSFINLILLILIFKETLFSFFKHKITLATGLLNLKKALSYKNIRILLLCTFLCGFAFSYFTDFIPVYLINKFQYSSAKIGIFYAAIGGVYAISSGILIRPFLDRFKKETLFFFSTIAMSIFIFSILLYPSDFYIWIFVIFFSFFASFINPTSTTLISNSVSDKIQGEVLGVLGSIITLSYALSALLAGALVGISASLPIYLGTFVSLISAVIMVLFFKKKLFTK